MWNVKTNGLLFAQPLLCGCPVPSMLLGKGGLKLGMNGIMWESAECHSQGGRSNTPKMAPACRHGAKGKDGVKVTWRWREWSFNSALQQRGDVTRSFRADAEECELTWGIFKNRGRRVIFKTAVDDGNLQQIYMTFLLLGALNTQIF